MSLKITYHSIASESPELSQERVDKAFDVLFDEVDRRLRQRASVVSSWLFIIPNLPLTIVSNNVYT